MLETASWFASENTGVLLLMSVSRISMVIGVKVWKRWKGGIKSQKIGWLSDA